MLIDLKLSKIFYSRSSWGRSLGGGLRPGKFKFLNLHSKSTENRPRAPFANSNIPQTMPWIPWQTQISLRTTPPPGYKSGSAHDLAVFNRELYCTCTFQTVRLFLSIGVIIVLLSYLRQRVLFCCVYILES